MQYGDLATPVDLKDDLEIDKPSTHQVWFSGGVPHGSNGRPLPISAQNNPRTITSDLVFPLSFSFKLKGDGGQLLDYPSFEEKISTYIRVLTDPARQKYGTIPQRGIREQVSNLASPLRYPDTMSARDGINDLTAKLAGMKVGIVGLGGTGGYILDFLSKTPLALIRLFDDDIVHVHTLFRIPGAASSEALGKPKVEVLYAVYSSFHKAIEPVAEKIGPSNLTRLADLDYVFIAVDDGPSRELIAQALEEFQVSYIDVGMGLYRTSSGLDGMLRVSCWEVPDDPSLIGTQYLPGKNPADNEYRRQPQIGELNALNAAIAVLRFKQKVGFYTRECSGHSSIFEIGSFELDVYGADS